MSNDIQILTSKLTGVVLRKSFGLHMPYAFAIGSSPVLQKGFYFNDHASAE